MNGASASGPNTEEGREGSNGAAGEMDASERRESELGGTLNSCGLVLWSAAAVSVPRGIWRLKNGLGERGEGGRRGRARAQDQTAKIKPSTRSQGSPSEWVPQSTKRSGSAFKAQPTKECAAVARFFPSTTASQRTLASSMPTGRPIDHHVDQGRGTNQSADV